MTDWTRDVRTGARALARSPGFAALAAGTLALGICAGTVVFSVVDHVVLRSLPYAHPERLVSVWPGGLLRGEIHFMQLHSRTLTKVAGSLQSQGFNLLMDDGGLRVSGCFIGPEWLEVLGLMPAAGRNFLPEEARAGGLPAAMISHAFWRQRFGADPKAVGARLTVDGTPRDIVGVLPAGLDLDGAEIALPLVMDPSNAGPYWGYGGHRAIARLSPGADPEDARRELRALSQRMRTANTLWTPTEDFRADAQVVPLLSERIGAVRPTLLVLLGAVAVVLLVACANVANLLLARGLSSGAENALRRALGASRWRIVRRRLTESALIAVVGGTAALGMAWPALNTLVALLPSEIPRSSEISLDGRVLAAGVALALLSGLAAGIFPALRGSRVDPAAVLSGARRGGSSLGRPRLSSWLVVGQIAAAVILVTAAGLLTRSLGALTSIEKGFEVDGLVAVRLSITGTRYEDVALREDYFRRVEERAAAIPGVRSAGLTSHVPFGSGAGGIATFIDGVTEDPNALPVLQRTIVTPAYLRTLGLPLRKGRSLRDGDSSDSPLVAVVDEAAVRHFWPAQSPVGRRIRYPWAGAPWIEVVGVVGGVADRDLASERGPTFYVPMAQTPVGNVDVLLRLEKGGASVPPSLRSVVREVDPQVPIGRISTLNAMISASLARARWTALLLGFFALTALALGCVGVYGAASHSVRARIPEIGVRMALGADPARLRRAVFKDGLGLALSGTVIGALLALPATRLLDGMLFGVDSFDPLTFGSTLLALLITALLAVCLPALRAMRVDPVEALRQ